MENLECAEKIACFESERKQNKKQNKRPPPSSSSNRKSAKRIKKETVGTGNAFKKSLPVSIKGYVKIDGHTHVLCEFADSRMDVVNIDVVKKKCPSLLIDNLEARLLSSCGKEYLVAGTSKDV